MLYIILGNLGSGKTLLMTYIASKVKDKKIYSNYNIKHKNFIELKPIDILNLPINIEVFLDEGYTWLESRLPSESLNRALSYILFQSRKRNTNFYISAQLFSTIDKRFRLMANNIIMCSVIGHTKKPLGFKYRLMDFFNNSIRTFILDLEIAKPVFKLYDTLEIIEPLNKANLEYNILKLDNQELIRVSNIFADNLRPIFKTLRLTYPNLELEMRKKNIDIRFKKLIYTILKANAI